VSAYLKQNVVCIYNSQQTYVTFVLQHLKGLAFEHPNVDKYREYRASVQPSCYMFPSYRALTLCHEAFQGSRSHCHLEISNLIKLVHTYHQQAKVRFAHQLLHMDKLSTHAFELWITWNINQEHLQKGIDLTPSSFAYQLVEYLAELTHYWHPYIAQRTSHMSLLQILAPSTLPMQSGVLFPKTSKLKEGIKERKRGMKRESTSTMMGECQYRNLFLAAVSTSSIEGFFLLPFGFR